VHVPGLCVKKKEEKEEKEEQEKETESIKRNTLCKTVINIL
jgi:hypothetical protein